MKKFAIICAAAAVLAAPVAMADSHGDHSGDKKAGMMSKYDLNGDGALTKDEFIKAHEDKFMKMDADGDGSITKDEMKAHKKAKREKMKKKRAEKKQERVNGAMKKAVE